MSFRAFTVHLTSTPNPKKDVIDKLDNENVIAIIDKPEIADSFTDAGDDNNFTPIVLGDIDISDAIDVNATKPIVVDTIDKVDEVEKEIKASQGKDVIIKCNLCRTNLSYKALYYSIQVKA